MAHPDKTRAGSEKGQRQHAGTTSAASDAGLKTRSQNGRGRTRVSGEGETAPPGGARTPEGIAADSGKKAAGRSGVRSDRELASGSPSESEAEKMRPGKD